MPKEEEENAKVRLFLIRHAETEANGNSVVLGQSDSVSSNIHYCVASLTLLIGSTPRIFCVCCGF